MGGVNMELLISCSDLVNLDEFTISDPMCVLYVRQFGQWQEYGRTESIRESLNPKFTETFILNVEQGVPQQIMLKVFDVDSRSTDLQRHGYIGATEMLLSDVMEAAAMGNSVTKTLRITGDSKLRGQISVTGEVVKEGRSRVFLQIGGHKLDKVGGVMTFNKPDTFLEMTRAVSAGSEVYHPIHRTEVVPRSRKPRWRPIELPIQKLCNNDWDRAICFTCWQMNTGSCRMIGQYNTTLRKLHQNRNSDNQHHFELFHPKKTQKKKDSGVGILKFYQLRLDMQYSLLDYVRGGCLLKLILAIDFTSSNGAMDDPNSFHGSRNNMCNQYEDVIETLGSMILTYSGGEKSAAVFGFGAKRDNSPISDCFPLSGQGDNPWMGADVQGILDCYHKTTQAVTFAGPTKFSPVIQKSMELTKLANLSQDNQMYHVLVIITDAIVNDYDDAIEELIHSSYLPLSVIFVNVGPSDLPFLDYVATDNDHLLRSVKTRQKSARPNVHAVSWRRNNQQNDANSMACRETIAKLSYDVTDFMKKRNIRPNEPKNFIVGPTLSRAGSTSSKDGCDGSMRMRSGSKTRRSGSIRSNGPCCPTCGAAIENNAALFGGIPPVSC